MPGPVDFAKWLGQQVFNVVVGPADWGGEAEEDTGLVDLQCGKTVFHNVPARMRTELWLSQLHKTGTADAAMRQYRKLLAQGVREEVLAEINKDTHRTFPGHARLSTPAGQNAMLRMLAAYAALDPEVGYTQGMNFVAGLLLTYIDSEVEAFGVLSMLMRDRGLRELYNPDLHLLQVRLWQLGRLLPSRLEAHLEAHAVLPVLYAPSWLLTCYASDFPIPVAARVLDLVITDCWAAPMMKVAVGILTRCQELLLLMDDFEQMVELLRQEVPRWPRVVLQELLTETLSQPWSPRQLRVLEQINDAETVIEAVQRVQNLQASTTTEGAEYREQLAESPTAAAAAVVGEAAAAAAAAAAHDSARPDRPQPQQQQLTPRTAAASQVLRLNPLPPPPTSRADQVAWGEWQATDQLQALPSSIVRIETDIGSNVELDEHLSAALSSYQGYLVPSLSSSPPPAASAGPLADTAAMPSPLAPRVLGKPVPAGQIVMPAPAAAALAAPAAPAPAAVASTPVGAGAAAGAAATVPAPGGGGSIAHAAKASLPSPFGGHAEARWVAVITEKPPGHRAAPSTGSTNAFHRLESHTSIFQNASSATALLRPPEQPAFAAAAAAAATAAAAAAGGSSDSAGWSLRSLFSRASPVPSNLSTPATPGSTETPDSRLGSLQSSLAARQLESLRLGSGSGRVSTMQQQSSDMDSFGSWKTGTTQDTPSGPRPSHDLASTASGGLPRQSADVGSRPSPQRLTHAEADSRVAQLLKANAEGFALTGRLDDAKR